MGSSPSSGFGSGLGFTRNIVLGTILQEHDAGSRCVRRQIKHKFRINCGVEVRSCVIGEYLRDGVKSQAEHESFHRRAAHSDVRRDRHRKRPVNDVAHRGDVECSYTVDRFFLHSSRRAWCAVTLRENHLKRLVSFDFERERESELATQELHFSLLGLQDCRGNRKTTLP